MSGFFSYTDDYFDPIFGYKENRKNHSSNLVRNVVYYSISEP